MKLMAKKIGLFVVAAILYPFICLVAGTALTVFMYIDATDGLE